MVFRYRGARHPMQQFRRDMDRLMSGFLGNLSEAGWPLTGRAQPSVNLWEDADAFHAELELPGVQNDQIELSVVGGEPR